MSGGDTQPERIPTPDDLEAGYVTPEPPSQIDDPDQHVELLPDREPLRTVMKGIGLAEQVIGTGLIFVILVLVLVQVAQRYVHAFGGWPWTGEIARLALVWCTFALSGYLMAQDRHITIKVIDLVAPERALRLVKLMSHLVVLATCLGMAYATYRLIADDIGQRTPAAEIPLTLFYLMPLAGFLLTTLRAVLVIGLEDLRRPHGSST